MRASSNDGTPSTGGEQLTRSGGATMTFNGLVVDIATMGIESAVRTRVGAHEPVSYEIQFTVNRRVFRRFVRDLLRRRYVPSTATLTRRICYGGRKGRSAERRLLGKGRQTVPVLEPSLTPGTSAYERWALFQARATKSVTVAGPGGLWTFGGPPRGATRAQKIAWFTAIQTEWPPSHEGQGAPK